LASFFPDIERSLEQILANQKWMKNALLILNSKVNTLMADLGSLEQAVSDLEAAADKTAAAIEALVAKGGVTQAQIDALTQRVTAVTEKLENAIPHAEQQKKK
jgi:chromosome segregation ATPase